MKSLMEDRSLEACLAAAGASRIATRPDGAGSGDSGCALAQRVEALPPLPAALAEVLRALNQEELSAKHCIDLIEHDQALAARTLRLANSAFYGMPGRVGSIGDAVRLLGLRTVAGVLTAATLHRAGFADHCPGFSPQGHWRHALGTALAARALAIRARQDSDLAFLAGLMHDVGRLVMAAFCCEQTAQVLAWSDAHDLADLDAERRVLGLDHAQLGALLVHHWQFPAAIVSAVASHHDDSLLAPDAEIDLRALVNAANLMAHSIDGARSQPLATTPITATSEVAPLLPPLLVDLCARLGHTPQETSELVEEVAASSRELSDQLLK